MTDIVVTSSNNTAVTSNPAINQVVTGDNSSTVIITGMMGPAVTPSITQANDIDITNLQNGSMLVYNVSTNKWVSTRLLDQQTIEAGQF
mgnify:CR=1 FL=1|jgi:hypothetical protein